MVRKSDNAMLILFGWDIEWAQQSYKSLLNANYAPGLQINLINLSFLAADMNSTLIA